MEQMIYLQPSTAKYPLFDVKVAAGTPFGYCEWLTSDAVLGITLADGSVIVAGAFWCRYWVFRIANEQ